MAVFPESLRRKAPRLVTEHLRNRKAYWNYCIDFDELCERIFHFSVRISTFFLVLKNICPSAHLPLSAEVSADWGSYQSHRMSHDLVTLTLQSSSFSCVTMIIQRVCNKSTPYPHVWANICHNRIRWQKKTTISDLWKTKFCFYIHERKFIVLTFVNNINPFSNPRFSDSEAYSWTKHFPFRHSQTTSIYKQKLPCLLSWTNNRISVS